MKLLGGLSPGLLFVVSAPAGTGKTTLVRMLTDEFDCVIESVSYTTRKIRPGEIEGRDYYFVSVVEFKKMAATGEFYEYAEVFGNYYGTSKKIVEGQLKQGNHVILVIDTQGARILKKILHAVYIFIRPPNFEELKKRLHGRKSESHESIETRLSWADEEIEASKNYDYVIVNENLTLAYEIFRSIFIAEEHRNRLK
ncbi:MAG TPA: guanylate kinase [Chlamydiales bacterium]|nr:guanylate kinase [Chlamydiales bacterium]